MKKIGIIGCGRQAPKHIAVVRERHAVHKEFQDKLTLEQEPDMEQVLDMEQALDVERVPQIQSSEPGSERPRPAEPCPVGPPPVADQVGEKRWQSLVRLPSA